MSLSVGIVGLPNVSPSRTLAVPRVTVRYPASRSHVYGATLPFGLHRDEEVLIA